MEEMWSRKLSKERTQGRLEKGLKLSNKCSIFCKTKQGQPKVKDKTERPKKGYWNFFDKLQKG